MKSSTSPPLAYSMTKNSTCPNKAPNVSAKTTQGVVHETLEREEGENLFRFDDFVETDDVGVVE
jgi:hypothetical protein